MSATKVEAWASSKWLSKSAAAKYIHVTDAAIRDLIDSGTIPAVMGGFRRGGAETVYIHVDDLDAYMRSRPYVPGNHTRVNELKAVKSDPRFIPLGQGTSSKAGLAQLERLGLEDFGKRKGAA